MIVPLGTSFDHMMEITYTQTITILLFLIIINIYIDLYYYYWTSESLLNLWECI